MSQATAPLGESILKSPDDGSSLTRNGDRLSDASGNEYPVTEGVYDLRPRTEVRGNLEYRLIPHAEVRNFPYRKSLTATEQAAETNVKHRNVAGFLRQAKDGELALDHGCGGGVFRKLMESRGYHYVGVDNEIGSSADQGGGDRFRHGATHLADLHRLPFADDTFSFAASYSVFEHLQLPQVAAKELFRVMRPGGVCFIAIASLIPFHMDSFYHHTHFGTLATLAGAGFRVDQIAPANWNGYEAISQMDGLPGPRQLRRAVGGRGREAPPHALGGALAREES